MKYYSHPNRLLLSHLKEVRDIGMDKLQIELREPFEIASLSHDFGKYTTFFQGYLINKIRSDYSNHGFISAIFGAYLSLNKYGEDSYLPLVIYNVILHHHGNIDNPSTNLPNKSKDIKRADFEFSLLRKIEAFKVQLNNIKENKEYIVEDMKDLGWQKEFFNFLEDENLIFEILSKLKKLEHKTLKVKSYEPYFIHQSIYSALIAADKISASQVKYDVPLFGEYNILNKIKDKSLAEDGSQINNIRNEIFTTVQDTLERRGKDSNIFFITSPTGTGKTYTGFFAAVKLRELLGLEGKIIYALPFTSIIEQNYDSIINIYKELEDFNRNKGRYIIKHHNLSKAEYESEYRDYTKTQSELLIENWESGVIITTFVQMFETLIGNRNRMLKKYVSFFNSIILLDEIQSIDIKYYKLIEFALEKLCELTNAKIIMMTATKPMILNNGIELLDNNEKYYQLFNRTKLIPMLENISIDDFVNDFIRSIEEKSYLIVCNTINQSLEIYDKLKDLDREIFYLSTNILPIHRRERLDEIRDRLKLGEKIILVSTQVVEAGVDLDFDEVIRDIGPLDSIIQCAGRCNRNGSKDIGSVKVYKMVNDRGFNYGKDIYGNTIINITTELLKDKSIIYEKEFNSIIEEYFIQILKNKSKDASQVLIEAINTLDFSKGDDSISTFSLIKNNPMYHDVLFLYDDVAEDAFEEYKEISRLKNFEEQREKYLKIGQVLKNYILSVPEKYCKTFAQEAGMSILPKMAIIDYYDVHTGFKRNDSEETLIF